MEFYPKEIVDTTRALKKQGVRVHLQLHQIHDKKEMISFWSKALNIPVKQFYKPTVTKVHNKRKREESHSGIAGDC
jgi:hypothetical protein